MKVTRAFNLYGKNYSKTFLSIFRYFSTGNRSFLKSFDLDAKSLKITLNFNKPYETKREFHIYQIMDFCRCKKCFSHKTGEKLYNIWEKQKWLEEKNNVEKLKVSYNNKEETLIFDWLENHQSEIPISNFLNHLDNKDVCKRTISYSLWDKDYFLSNEKKEISDELKGKEAKNKFLYLNELYNIPKIDYKDVINNEKETLQLLKKLLTYGLCFVTGVPLNLKDNEHLGKQLAYFKATMYGGDIYKYEYDPKFEDLTDVSQTLTDLPLHVDCSYLQNGVGYQFFHIPVADLEGYGTTFMVDGFKIMNNLKQNNYETYKYFLNNKVHISREDDSSLKLDHFINLFKEDKNSRYEECLFSLNHLRTNHLNYDEFEEFQKHFGILMSEVYSEKNIVRIQMMPGEVLFFNNKRIFHARTKLSGKIKRDFISAYYDEEVIIARYRFLFEKYNNPIEYLV